MDVTVSRCSGGFLSAVTFTVLHTFAHLQDTPFNNFVRAKLMFNMPPALVMECETSLQMYFSWKEVVTRVDIDRGWSNSVHFLSHLLFGT